MNNSSKNNGMKPAESLLPEIKDRAIGCLKVSIVMHLLCLLVFGALAVFFVILSEELIPLAIFTGAVPVAAIFAGVYAELKRISCLKNNLFEWKESVIGKGMFPYRQRHWEYSKSYGNALSVDGIRAYGIGLSMLRRGDEVYDFEIYDSLPLQISSRFQMKK